MSPNNFTPYPALDDPNPKLHDPKNDLDCHSSNTIERLQPLVCPAAQSTT